MCTGVSIGEHVDQKEALLDDWRVVNMLMGLKSKVAAIKASAK